MRACPPNAKEGSFGSFWGILVSPFGLLSTAFWRNVWLYSF
jgi:hypothetical protein